MGVLVLCNANPNSGNEHISTQVRDSGRVTSAPGSASTLWSNSRVPGRAEE